MKIEICGCYKCTANLVDFQTIFPELTGFVYCRGYKGARLSASNLEVRKKRGFYITHQNTGCLAFDSLFPL